MNENTFYWIVLCVGYVTIALAVVYVYYKAGIL
jgi:hypothetical protein